MKSRQGSMTILKMFVLGMIIVGTAAMSFDGSIQAALNLDNVSVVAPAIVAPANPVSFSGAVRGSDGALGTDALRARQGQPGSGADLASISEGFRPSTRLTEYVDQDVPSPNASLPTVPLKVTAKDHPVDAVPIDVDCVDASDAAEPLANPQQHLFLLLVRQ